MFSSIRESSICIYVSSIVPVNVVIPSVMAFCLFSLSLVSSTTLGGFSATRGRCFWYQSEAVRMARSLRSFADSPGCRSTYVSLHQQHIKGQYHVHYNTFSTIQKNYNTMVKSKHPNTIIKFIMLNYVLHFAHK